MHINYKNRLFMKDNLYINNFDAISFSSSRSLTLKWRDRGEKELGQRCRRDAVDAKSHKFMSTSNLTQFRGAWTSVWCFSETSNYCCSRDNSLA